MSLDYSIPESKEALKRMMRMSQKDTEPNLNGLPLAKLVVI